MKKFFIMLSTALVALLAFCSTARGQDWITDHVDADELKGTPAYDMHYFFDEDNNLFAISTGTHKSIGVQTSSGILDYDEDHMVKALIGYYVDGKLVNKETVLMRVGQNNANMALSLDAFFYDRITSHLKKGDVRVIVERYNRSDLDMTVTKNPEL